MGSAKEIRHYLAENTTFLKVIRSRKLSRFPSPSTFRLPKTLIVHSTSSSNGGKEEKDKIGHWISILLTDNEALFFDSFGRKPNDLNITIVFILIVHLYNILLVLNVDYFVYLLYSV